MAGSIRGELCIRCGKEIEKYFSESSFAALVGQVHFGKTVGAVGTPLPPPLLKALSGAGSAKKACKILSA